MRREGVKAPVVGDAELALLEAPGPSAATVEELAEQHGIELAQVVSMMDELLAAGLVLGHDGRTDHVDSLGRPRDRLRIEAGRAPVRSVAKMTTRAYPANVICS